MPTSMTQSKMNKCNGKRLIIGLLNVRSLNTEKDELIVTMEKYNPDILALNETWLKEGQEICAPKIPGYTLKLLPRPRDKRGGGVGFYIRSGIRTRNRPHPPSDLEQMWLEVSISGVGRIAIGTAYRPESGVTVSSAIDALSQSISTFGYCNHILLVTDFNVDLLLPFKSPALEVISFLNQQNLSQLVNEPTRITDSTATLLDLFITDSPELVRKIDVHHNRTLSDHAIILAELQIKKPKNIPQFIFKRLLNKINYEEFMLDLNSLPWHTIAVRSNVDEMLDQFNEFVILLFDKHAPLKRIRVSQKQHPWITDVIKIMMVHRDEALKRANKTKLDTHRQYYRELKNLVNSSLKREKAAFFNYYVNKNIKKPQKMWKYLKRSSVTHKPDQPNIPRHLNCPDDINNFFLDIPGISDAHSDNLLYYAQNRYTDNEFNLDFCSEELVNKIIHSISTNAYGFDTISIEMIRMTLPCTLPIITSIINKSLETTTVPKSWKLAKVKPLPKTNVVEQVKDLRAISLLPVLSKIIERVVSVQLTKYLEKEKILPILQSGFRSGRGTDTSLAHVTDDILTASDKGQGSILVLLDFSRAFDCLNTQLLLAKLRYYGISQTACSWFQSYLNDRQQYVETVDENGNMKQSRILDIPRGCPQGSILSPLLFIIYTADLPKHLKNCKVHLYADDTQIYRSFPPLHIDENIQKINEDLNEITSWSKDNSLVINPEKSKFLVLGTKHQSGAITKQIPILKIDNKNIDMVKSARNLGLIMDSELRFIDHVNSKIRNAFYRLKVLYGYREFLSEEVRVTLTETLVLSLFNFGDVVYGPRLFSKTERAIQRVQNACARFCFTIPRRAHITPFLNEKGILKMTARRHLHLANLLHKVVHKQVPEYLYEKIIWKSDILLYNTRNRFNNKLKIPVHKTVGYKGSFSYAASKIWNDLPPPLRQIKSPNTFKTKLRSFLLMKQQQDFTYL